jgi:biotin carboxylase
MGENNRKTVLILGASTMQLPSIRIAREKGWRIIVADADPRAPGIKLADIFEEIDLKDREGMARMAEQYVKEGNLDGVFTAGTDFSTTVAWVAERCGLPGISYDTALSATDKDRMREKLKKAGVSCPDYVSLTEEDDPETALAGLSLPLVVKPVDSMGSRAVKRVDSLSELKRAYGEALKISRASRVILEAYMDGPELSLDAVIYKGQAAVCGVADRYIRFPPYFVEMGHTIPSALDKSELDKAEELFRRGIAALGIDNGAAKGDIKLTSGGPMVGEIAARLSGGYMSGWTYPYSSGVMVTGAALNIAVGLPPGDLSPKRRHVSAERAFISIPGRISEIYGKREAERVEGIRDVFFRVGVGDEVRFPRNNVEKCGNVISQAAGRKDAAAAAEEAAGKIMLRLEEGHPATRAFLFDDHPSGIEAFSLKAGKNLKAFRSMPDLIEGTGQMVLLGLPALEEESALDWHGLSVRQALDRVVSLTGIPVSGGNPSGGFAIGSMFWKCLLKGGAQGGVYLVDTMRKLRMEGKPIRNFFMGPER